ncbi:MAG: hypothetical protein BKP49_04495 [Treponema sp. CETP13]|nr:MAG: hypothetical protein BKP49_04495 [Treponema sp. CETP13]
MKRKLLYTNFSKDLYILGLIEFINGLGSFVFPFLALFLTQKLGYSATKTGYYMLLISAIYVPGSLITSHIADKISRKKIVVLTQFCFSVSIIIAGVFVKLNPTLVPLLVIIALFFDGATDPARQALYTDHTTLENRQEAFSFFYLCMNIGFAFGPAIAGFLFNSYPSWIFIGQGIAGVLTLAIMIGVVRDKSPTKEMLQESLKSESDDKAVNGTVLKALLSRPLLCMYILIVSFFGFARSLSIFGLPLYVSNIFANDGPSKYGFLMSANAILVVSCTAIIVGFSKKHRSLTMISLAVFLYAISFFFMGRVTSFVILIILTILFSIGEVFSATNSNYFVMNHTPLGHRARFSSILTIIQGTGFAIAPFIAGIILDAHNFKTLFTTSSVLLFVCCFLILVLRKLYINKEKKDHKSI